MSEFSFCKVESRSLEEYVARLGAMVAYYRGRGRSTYERTKEVWGALQTLLRTPPRHWNEILGVIVKRYTIDVRREDVRKCFENLLRGLLEKFIELARNYNPHMRLELAKAIRDALDVSVSSPKPEIDLFIKEFYPEKLEGGESG
mgnify:CR=1 FL=1